MNNSSAASSDTLAEVDALPRKRPKVKLQYGSSGYDSEQSFVIKGLIPESSLACIYGPSGSFKSFLALDWACHIASGKDWDGYKVKQGAVLYVAGEGGFGVTKRVRAWELQNQVSNIGNLARLPVPVFPGNRDQVQTIIDYCDEIKSTTGQKVQLIILDTLARCYGGKDENSSQDMGAFIAGCDMIKQLTGATVLIVHHSGKSVEKGGRGSSSLPAALDVEYQINRSGEDLQELILTCTKMKDAEQPETKAYELDTVYIRTDSDGDDINSLCVIPIGKKPCSKGTHPANTPRWSTHHTAIWQSVKTRTETNGSTTKSLVRGDIRSQGFDIKHFGRWLSKLSREGALTIDGDTISMPNNGDEN
jgi:putative DNA primase/helicase